MEIQSAINKTKGLIYILKMARRLPTTKAEDEKFLNSFRKRFQLNQTLIKETSNVHRIEKPDEHHGSSSS